MMLKNLAVGNNKFSMTRKDKLEIIIKQKGMCTNVDCIDEDMCPFNVNFVKKPHRCSFASIQGVTTPEK